MRTSFLARAITFSLAAALAACSSGSNGGGGSITLVSTTPADNATGVALTAPIVASFSAPVNSSTVSKTSFSLSPSLDGNNAFTTNGGKVTLSHGTPFAASTKYTVTLAATIADTSGDTLGAAQTFSFTTGTGSSTDTTPPAAVNDLAASAETATSITLTWTAVGDNGTTGTAASYDLRYATGAGCPLSSSNFASGTAITTSAPKAAGQTETATASGLTASTSYCFALEVSDAAGNVSALSNVVTESTSAPSGDTTPPSAVTDLAAADTSASAIHLTWTAPSDDSGTVASYDLRQASGAACPITDATFAAATAVTTGTPAAAGSADSADATGLTASTSYCFALKSSDAAGNVSAISNVATATTAAAAPGTIGDLTAAATNESIALTWTAPAHNAGATYTLFMKTGACPADSSGFTTGATATTGIAASAAGMTESHTVPSLTPSTDYCFGLEVVDGANTSAISNLAHAKTGDDVKPATVSDLAASNPTGSSVDLTWTAPGDNGSTGTVASYDLRYQAQGSSATNCSAFSYASATHHTFAATIVAGGQTQHETVGGLAGGTSYCFALTATDAAGNVSAVSNAAFSTTVTDTTPPATPDDLAISNYDSDTGAATLTFTMTGDNGTTGQAAEVDLYSLTGAACPITSSNLGQATLAATDTAPAAAGQTETIADSSVIADVFCFAVKVKDAAGNSSGLSNSPVFVAHAGTAPTALSASDVTTTGFTFNWTEGSGDGTSIDTAASQEIAYQQAADCTTFSFTGATAVGNVPPPAASGTAQTVSVTGLGSNTSYCIGIQSTDAYDRVSPISTLLVTTIDTPQNQLAALRAAIAAGSSATIALNQNLDNVIVSYVKTSTGAVPDGNGFFLQNTAGGPAIYVALDASTFLGASGPALVAGDVLDMNVTQAKWLDCSSCKATNGQYVITAATGTLAGTGATLPAATPLASTDVVPPATANWPLESVLVSGAVTVTGPFVNGGTGYLDAPVTTGGDPSPAAGTLVLRAPTTLVASAGLTSGSVINIVSPGTPLWRFNAEGEIAVWQASELTTTSSPTLTLASSNPANNATGAQVAPTIALGFSAPIDTTTLVPTTAGACTGNVRLATSAAPATCIAVPSLTGDATNSNFTASSTVTLSTDTTYVLTLTGVKSTNGQSLATTTITFTTAAAAEDCTHMVISQLYGGGGNSGATYTNDFIELHNNGSTEADLTGCSVQYTSAAGTAAWSVTPLSSVKVAAGAYYLIQEAAGSGTGTATQPTPDQSSTVINLSATAGTVALVNGTTAITTGTCPSTTVVDLVGFGTGACKKTGDAAQITTSPADNQDSIIRGAGGCTNSGNNTSDFSENVFATTGIGPRGTAAGTAAAVCSQ